MRCSPTFHVTRHPIKVVRLRLSTSGQNGRSLPALLRHTGIQRRAEPALESLNRRTRTSHDADRHARRCRPRPRGTARLPTTRSTTAIAAPPSLSANNAVNSSPPSSKSVSRRSARITPPSWATRSPGMPEYRSLICLKPSTSATTRPKRSVPARARVHQLSKSFVKDLRLAKPVSSSSSASARCPSATARDRASSDARLPSAYAASATQPAPHAYARVMTVVRRVVCYLDVALVMNSASWNSPRASYSADSRSCSQPGGAGRPVPLPASAPAEDRQTLLASCPNEVITGLGAPAPPAGGSRWTPPYALHSNRPVRSPNSPSQQRAAPCSVRAAIAVDGLLTR